MRAGRLDLIGTVLQRSGGDYAVRLTTREELGVNRNRQEELLAQFETDVSEEPPDENFSNTRRSPLLRAV